MEKVNSSLASYLSKDITVDKIEKYFKAILAFRLFDFISTIVLFKIHGLEGEKNYLVKSLLQLPNPELTYLSANIIGVTLLYLLVRSFPLILSKISEDDESSYTNMLRVFNINMEFVWFFSFYLVVNNSMQIFLTINEFFLN